jgi:hypothetical protein
MTFNDEVDRVLNCTRFHLSRLGQDVSDALHWTMVREQILFLKQPTSFDLRAGARQALREWYTNRYPR